MCVLFSSFQQITNNFVQYFTIIYLMRPQLFWWEGCLILFFYTQKIKCKQTKHCFYDQLWFSLDIINSNQASLSISLPMNLPQLWIVRSAKGWRLMWGSKCWTVSPPPCQKGKKRPSDYSRSVFCTNFTSVSFVYQ